MKKPLHNVWAVTFILITCLVPYAHAGDYGDELTTPDWITAGPTPTEAEYMIGEEGGGSDVINRPAKSNFTFIQELADGAIGNNLLKNGDMEQWTNGTSVAADNWTLSGAGASVARSTTKKIGTYSSEITTSGAAASYYQDIPDYVRYQGIYVTLGVWVKCSTASAARIGISDAVTTAWSTTYHTGGGAWELLTVTLNVDGAASYLRILLQIDNTSAVAYFDAVKAEEGQIATAFSPYIVTPYVTETLRNKTLITPTIADLTNMPHDHSNAANGGLYAPKAGTVVQVVNVMDGAVATGTTVMPYDDTIPQNTEGDEYMTLAITPTSATNKLKIEVVFNYAASADTHHVFALFQDSTASALAAVASTPSDTIQSSRPIGFTHYMTSGTTSSTTFKLRAGPASGTLTFNGVVGARRLGGVMASSITITEIQF